jgi:hypothetical protein
LSAKLFYNGETFSLENNGRVVINEFAPEDVVLIIVI